MKRLCFGCLAIFAWFMSGLSVQAQETTSDIPQWPDPQTIAVSVRLDAPVFRAGTIVTTAFSGTVDHVPTNAAELSPQGLKVLTEAGVFRFINLDGMSASLLRPDRLGQAYDGSQITDRPYDKILARDVGQVFGLAFDDQEHQNLYLTATSVFGLQIIGPDVNGDDIPERLQNGQLEVRWMAGQWGGFEGSGPGSIYRLNGETGQIDLFANITLDGVANSGAGLGNIAFDPAHDQLFVSDLETGVVHRLTLDGQDVQQFDHGRDVRPTIDLDPVAYESAGAIDITLAEFDALDPETWHFAPAERRVWGLAVHGSRLYYAVALGSEIWSVGIDNKTGEILADARWELSVATENPEFDIADILFTPEGAMVLAQRPTLVTSFDYTEMADPAKAEVLRYSLESPKDDPDTPSIWFIAPERIAVGFADLGHNALGGVTLGPAYTDRGRIDWADCRGSLWSTGEDLRLNADLADPLAKGGAFEIDGLQTVPRVYPAADNSPPWTSYFHDFDGETSDLVRIGDIGDVEANGCRGEPGTPGAALVPNPLPEQIALPPNTTGDPRFWCTNGVLQAGLCLCALFPSKCFPDDPPKDVACAAIETTVICDAEMGVYVLDLGLTDLSGGGLDTTKLTDPSGAISSLPTSVPFPGTATIDLTGLFSGQTGQVNICAFNAAEQETGEPFSCCNTTANFKVPGEPCGEGVVE